MDNISHTVAGLAAGEFIHRSLAPEPAEEANLLRRKLFLVACVVSGNFPDLDLIFSKLLPAPLGYLLHHRGHTHTILYAVPQAMLLAIAILLCWPNARGLLRASLRARIGFALSIAVGFALHLGLDYLNSYGLHPFHPFDSQWVYGDLVFIVEPFFWVVLSAPLLMAVKRRPIRNFVALALATLQIAFFYLGLLPWGSVLVLVAAGLAIAALEKADGPRRRRSLLLAFALTLAFVGLQFYASSEAKHLIKTGLAIRDESAVILDVAATPSPTNPLCWGFIAVEKHEPSASYRLTRGRVSLRQDMLPVSECSRLTSETIEEKPEILSGLIFTGDDTGDLALLRRLATENCNLRAWLRFSRVPFVTERYAIDQRFSARGQSANFSYFNIEDFAADKCAGPIPAWGFPRADLIDVGP